MNVFSTPDASGVRASRGAVIRRPRLLASLSLTAALAGCAATDPCNWQVFGPPDSYVRPAPVIVAPAPTLIVPTPVPATVIVTPGPTVIAPGPTLVTPFPPAPFPPVLIAPAPPYVFVPSARPYSSRDAAHFLQERCYLEKGGCYTTEYQQGYEFNPYTGTWDWVGQRDYRWKGHRRHH